MSDLGALSPDDKSKLEHIMSTGISMLQQVEDIKGAMKDTVKAVADELSIKPKDLNEAIRTAFKSKLAEKKETLATVEDILDVTGHA